MTLTLKAAEMLNFVLSCFTFLFFLAGLNADVEGNLVFGALYDFLGIPVFVLLIILPISSLILWVKSKFNFASFGIYAFLLLLFTWGMLFYQVSSVQC